jgi:hypothetical protein
MTDHRGGPEGSDTGRALMRSWSCPRSEVRCDPVPGAAQPRLEGSLMITAVAPDGLHPRIVKVSPLDR